MNIIKKKQFRNSDPAVEQLLAFPAENFYF